MNIMQIICANLKKITKLLKIFGDLWSFEEYVACIWKPFRRRDAYVLFVTIAKVSAKPLYLKLETFRWWSKILF